MLLLCSFLFQEISYANPDLKIIAWGGADTENSKAWARKLLPAIPESVATIEDAYKAPDSKKTLILIQDAHTNTSGQFNVARALDLVLQKDPIKYVFLEAGSGNESLSFLRKYTDLENRKRVAESFLRDGKLQGSEYADLTTDHNFVLWGVEDLKLYDKSVKTYGSVAKQRNTFENYLTRIDSTIQVLKPKVYNPFLLSFDDKYQKFQKEEISLTEYFGLLIKEAKRLGLNSYPHLKALNKLKELESKIDFKKAGEEQQAAVSSLPDNDKKELLEAAKENH